MCLILSTCLTLLCSLPLPPNDVSSTSQHQMMMRLGSPIDPPPKSKSAKSSEGKAKLHLFGTQTPFIGRERGKKIDFRAVNPDEPVILGSCFLLNRNQTEARQAANGTNQISHCRQYLLCVFWQLSRHARPKFPFPIPAVHNGIPDRECNTRREKKNNGVLALVQSSLRTQNGWRWINSAIEPRHMALELVISGYAEPEP